MKSSTVYRVSETFLSLQGEGPSIGTPAAFLRLQGCAVGCSWCDTRFSWPADGGMAVTLDELADALPAANLLVVTGGEPLAHPGIYELLRWALRGYLRVEVETSGIGEPPIHDTRLTYNWSPKLSRVTPQSGATWSHADAFATVNSICKIVVETREDFVEAAWRVRKALIPNGRVVIMPQGVEALDIDERMRWLAPLCIERGFRLSPRLHVQLWGKERGR